MPAEWAPHERTLMAWPQRAAAWRGVGIEQARADHAEIARSIARFEPVLMVVDPTQVDAARASCVGEVEVVGLPIDDSWLRDSGPLFVVGAGGRRAGVDFGFNGWGERFTPYANDAAVAARLLEQLGIERHEAPLVLEGGSIALDGEGTLITTEQCLLHPSRNPGRAREEIEALLCRYLGVEVVIWLGQGLVEDVDTDGHVDNVCAFVRPGAVLAQTVSNRDDPDWAICQENLRRLRAARDARGRALGVIELDLLPRVVASGRTVAVPYMNYYVANGAVIVPVAGQASDARALELIGAAYPGREVVPVPGLTLALGGGGVHCITQQVPAVQQLPTL